MPVDEWERSEEGREGNKVKRDARKLLGMTVVIAVMVSQVDTNSALYIGTVYDITYTSVKPLKEIKEVRGSSPVE